MRDCVLVFEVVDIIGGHELEAELSGQPRRLLADQILPFDAMVLDFDVEILAENVLLNFRCRIRFRVVSGRQVRRDHASGTG